MHINIKLFFLLFLFVISRYDSIAQKTGKYNRDMSLFDHGKVLYLKQQYIPAINDFEEFLKSKPQSNIAYEANAYLQLSRLHLGKTKAANDLADLIKEQPEHQLNGEIILELGFYYFDDGKYSRALRYLKNIAETEVSPSRKDELVFKKGYSFFMAEEYETAKNEFAKLLNRKSSYAIQATYYYGYQCYILKDYECALNTFLKIGDKGPKTMQLYIAQIYYEQKHYEKAFGIIKDLRLEKQEDEIVLLKGKIQYQLGNYSIALSHFDNYTAEVSELNPDEIYQFAHSYFIAEQYSLSTRYYLMISNREDSIGQAANYHLGISYLKNKQNDRAFNAFGEAKRKNFDPEITEISAFNYAKLAAELKQNTLAINVITDFLDEYPQSEYQVEVQGLMAGIYLSTKNYKAAIEVLESMQTLDEKTRSAYQVLTYHRGEELYLNKQYQQSETMFLKSLRYPKDKRLEAQACFWMGEIAFKQHKHDESIKQLNRFVSNSGSDQSKDKNYAYYSLAYNYFKKNDYLKAQTYFEQYNKRVSYTTENRDIYLDNTQRLADCYFLNRQYNKAIECYGFYIDKNYKSADYALFQQGMLYGLIGQADAKINTLKKIQKDFTKSVYLDDALYQIGNEYMVAENYAMAENIFNLLISQHDYSVFLAESYLKLGLIHYNQNSNELALGYYKTVVERFPKSSESKEALSFIEIIYVKQGQAEDWINYAESVDAGVRVTNQDSLIYESAMVLYRKGDCDRAVENFQSYISRFGDKGYFIIPVNYYKAECDYFNNRKDEALKHYDFVANQHRNDFSEKSNTKLADVYYARKDYAKSVSHYAALEPLASSKNIFIKSLMGQIRCHYFLSEYDKAKAKAIELLPVENVPKEDLVEANMILGRIQLRDSNYLTAVFHFDYVIKESKNQMTAEALYNRAYIRFLQNNPDSSRNDIYQLNDDFSAYEFWVVKGFILLSDIYLMEKDYFQAKATLQSILDHYKKEDDGLLDICQMKLKEIEKQEKP